LLRRSPELVEKHREQPRPLRSVLVRIPCVGQISSRSSGLTATTVGLSIPSGLSAAGSPTRCSSRSP
jgi:hypothetical protein